MGYYYEDHCDEECDHCFSNDCKCASESSGDDSNDNDGKSNEELTSGNDAAPVAAPAAADANDVNAPQPARSGLRFWPIFRSGLFSFR